MRLDSELKQLKQKRMNIINDLNSLFKNQSIDEFITNIKQQNVEIHSNFTILHTPSAIATAQHSGVTPESLFPKHALLITALKRKYQQDAVIQRLFYDYLPIPFEESYVNLAYRWFCKLNLVDKVPHHSSLPKIRNRFGLQVFKSFFNRIVEQCKINGLVKSEGIITEGTLIHANSSIRLINIKRLCRDNK